MFSHSCEHEPRTIFSPLTFVLSQEKINWSNERQGGSYIHILPALFLALNCIILRSSPFKSDPSTRILGALETLGHEVPNYPLQDIGDQIKMVSGKGISLSRERPGVRQSNF